MNIRNVLLVILPLPEICRAPKKRKKLFVLLLAIFPEAPVVIEPVTKYPATIFQICSGMQHVKVPHLVDVSSWGKWLLWIFGNQPEKFPVSELGCFPGWYRLSF